MALEGFEFAPVNCVPSLVICEDPIFANQVPYILVDAYKHVEEVPIKEGRSAMEYVGAGLMFSVCAVTMLSHFSKRDTLCERDYQSRTNSQTQ
jgi:hypothetical protein